MFWFLITLSIVMMSAWWLNLTAAYRMISLISMLVASFLLLLNYNVKTFGRSIFQRSDHEGELSVGEQRSVANILHSETHYRRKLFLITVCAIAYAAALLSAAPRIKTQNELFTYVLGWPILCLIFDMQIRTHLLVVFVRKVLSRS
jgi:hypothetical protein